MAIDYKTFLIVSESLNLPVVECRASKMSDGDLLGLEQVEGNTTKWLAPDWLRRACDEPVILFFTEVDRAIYEVRNALLNLVESRKLAGGDGRGLWHLHPETKIAAMSPTPSPFNIREPLYDYHFYQCVIEVKKS